MLALLLLLSIDCPGLMADIRNYFKKAAISNKKVSDIYQQGNMFGSCGFSVV